MWQMPEHLPHRVRRWRFRRCPPLQSRQHWVRPTLTSATTRHPFAERRRRPFGSTGRPRSSRAAVTSPRSSWTTLPPSAPASGNSPHGPATAAPASRPRGAWCGAGSATRVANQGAPARSGCRLPEAAPGPKRSVCVQKGAVQAVSARHGSGGESSQQPSQAAARRGSASRAAALVEAKSAKRISPSHPSAVLLEPPQNSMFQVLSPVQTHSAPQNLLLPPAGRLQHRTILRVQNCAAVGQHRALQAKSNQPRPPATRIGAVVGQGPGAMHHPECQAHGRTQHGTKTTKGR
mmetsp:Transcript_68011/g.221375  ORF Transcript_68011/g.221375 Transcript_68011/m.221375 type:complete len:291 (-) Transcript_68011:703-1575(-)